ncbi:MAG: hypothetical protein WA463_17985 [Terriglobales bacterium]
MSIPKKSFTERQPLATAHPPGAAASPATRPSPRLAVKTRNPGPGQTWFNLTRRDIEKMSWEQLQKKADTSHQQSAATDQGSLWQRLASLFRRSDKGK